MSSIFERKYCWIDFGLYKEFENIAQRVKDEREIELTPQQISHLFTIMLRENNICFDLNLIKFKHKDYIQFDETERELVKKVIKNAATIIQEIKEQ